MQLSLRFADLNRFNVPEPPHREQLMIAEYIRARAFELDALKDHAQREIDLLQESSTRRIADVVTGKLEVRAAAARPPEEAEEPEAFEDEALAESDGEARGENLDTGVEEAAA